MQAQDGEINPFVRTMLNMEKQFFEQFPEARIAHEHQLQLAYAYVNPDWHSPGEFSPSDSQLPTSDSSSSGSSSLACSLDCAPVHGNQTPLNLSSPHGSSPGCMPYPSAGFSQPDTFLYPRPDPASSLQEPFEGFSATLPTTSSLSLAPRPIYGGHRPGHFGQRHITSLPRQEVQHPISSVPVVPSNDLASGEMKPQSPSYQPKLSTVSSLSNWSEPAPMSSLCDPSSRQYYMGDITVPSNAPADHPFTMSHLPRQHQQHHHKRYDSSSSSSTQETSAAIPQLQSSGTRTSYGADASLDNVGNSLRSQQGLLPSNPGPADSPSPSISLESPTTNENEDPSPADSPSQSAAKSPLASSGNKSAKKNGDKKPPLACLFCRGRKIACGSPVPGGDDHTCNQCHRRGLKCEYPAESRRGMRRKRSASDLDGDRPETKRSSSKSLRTRR